MEKFIRLPILIWSIALSIISCDKTNIELENVDSQIINDKNIECVIARPCFNPLDIDPDVVCYAVYAPVCACDAITFDNACLAEAAGFNGYKEGTCLQQQCYNSTLKTLYEDVRCQEKEDVVCGCNNLTYRNPCEAYKEGITQFHPGKCEYGEDINLDSLREHGCFDPTTIDTLAVCPTFDPVCACGLVQFANACEAKSFGFQNYETGLCPQKRCKSDYLPGYYLALGMTCAPGVPVCGCDGVTYKSACHAVTSGTLYWTPGECGSITFQEIP